ncbi:50S ribosomal protein L23 [Candidatus Daviesbacteria bacterium RIFCSPLOWO2_02_FULL_41_8]|uniref:Large ribosomal subunit protein uL23 n=3 Tax=Candidatus Daviesiibacteriota TaxID=1752718 RepID=A0A1F5NLV3_9BACT|nr:MAG: 50S ribosomal protein L23 [Candidatus Daviesbacteria bacterium RIFCSPHIGHO2_01_FULL_41_23]OGE32785.1 MAG: 50S ribosomal protein L23 [Candidatus Daviesbacteria bacterium RIFCSPHIGHO2_02_FULL_41_10]OGE62127.1 MAG: 50S ribosomal protein L23 [Candidatus Daviesbacteria bacterium RIFCSPLOWO2_01_FULL_41_32]OGE78608.1 MAG: 50S ribosomal protein L23 [Candidatus Daviesbacteria bacterium RIFCSPLOWO2_02_FULL_41_8]
MIVIKRPIITEKSMKLAQGGLYVFEVDKDATKPLVAKAVAEKFNVKVLKVKIINVKGKSKQQRKVRKIYKTGGFKKALVQVGKGQTIAIFETPKEEVTVTTAEGEPIKLKEKKDFLGRTKVKVEKTGVGASPTTQRKVITGK